MDYERIKQPIEIDLQDSEIRIVVETIRMNMLPSAIAVLLKRSSLMRVGYLCEYDLTLH